jgi:hypothetical protein
MAIAAGIEIDEVRSVGGCDSDDSLSKQQIQIAFRSDFRKAIDFNQRLNDETLNLVTQSLVIERNSIVEGSETIVSKICVAIVPSSS